MGRRPNQLVVEFFHRGKKLEDASNRYEHACKKCGEVFPKGRIDALMGHILRRCPHVSQQDRELVLHQVQHSQEMRRNAKNSNSFTAATPSCPIGEHLEMQMASSHHNLILAQQSALDTLAEVSRRHMDYSTYRPSVDLAESSQPKNLTDEGQALAEQALIASLQQHVAASSYVGQMAVDDSENHLSGSVAGPEALRSNSHQFETHVVCETTTATSTADDSQNQRSQSGNETGVHQIQETHPPSMPVDPKLDDVGMETNSTPPMRHPSQDGDIAWAPDVATDLQSFDSLVDTVADDRQPQGCDVVHKGLSRRRRGVFSDSRREEVKANRKRGACLRCRMLKKSCSDGTPCHTCSSVETARVWKDTCIRTRIVDTFPLWSVALYHHKAKAEVPAAVEGLVQVALPGRLEVSLCAASDLCMTFAAKQYTSTVSPRNRIVGLSLLDEPHHSPKAIWLLDEGVEMADKIEDYVNCIADVYVRTEPCSAIKALLLEARSIVQTETISADHQSRHDAHDARAVSARSCYSLQDQLVNCMVQLWVYTRILADPNLLPLRVQYNAREIPQQEPSRFGRLDGAEAEEYNPRDVPHNSHSYDLIKSQLLALTEVRCMKLSRVVMNEMERRLLQRRQVSRNATFISALVLLNCVERTTSFYRGFDACDSINEQSDFAHNQSPAAASIDRRRRLEYQQDLAAFFAPSKLSSTLGSGKVDELWLHGERFANLLIMMLRLRGLPPKTTCDESNRLITVYSLSGDAKRAKADNQNEDRALANWLDPIQFDFDDLVGKRDSSLPGRAAHPSTWDMHFISRILLPDTQD
nr:hypothetical protein CFP56_62708 [Quercus suber]